MACATVHLNPAYADLHFIGCPVTQKMAARRGSVTETRVEWIKPEIVNNCEACQASFGIFRRKHHCRYCGHVFCDSCTPSQMKLPPQFGYTEPQVDRCLCSMYVRIFRSQISALFRQRVCNPCIPKIQAADTGGVDQLNIDVQMWLRQQVRF